MQIKYLTAMQAHPTIGSFTNRGFSQQQITQLEQQYNEGKPFPLAFREFLYLAGDFCNIALQIDDWDFMQEEAHNSLIQTNNTIDRPFFVLFHLNACEHFSFFYLDEAKDDPDMYHARPYATKRNEPLIERMPNNYTLSTLTAEAVRRKLDKSSF